MRSSLTLCNDYAELARLTAWIDELVVPLELPSRTAHALQLCLEEAVTNIITHAFDPCTAHEIRVALWWDEAALYSEITDDGRPFDPLSYEPAQVTDLQSASIGGHGIRLMRSFANRIEYRRCGSINRLLLSFQLI